MFFPFSIYKCLCLKIQKYIFSKISMNNSEVESITGVISEKICDCKDGFGELTIALESRREFSFFFDVFLEMRQFCILPLER
jgi:hypothetical protein